MEETNNNEEWKDREEWLKLANELEEALKRWDEEDEMVEEIQEETAESILNSYQRHYPDEYKHVDKKRFIEVFKKEKGWRIDDFFETIHFIIDHHEKKEGSFFTHGNDFPKTLAYVPQEEIDKIMADDDLKEEYKPEVIKELQETRPIQAQWDEEVHTWAKDIIGPFMENYLEMPAEFFKDVNCETWCLGQDFEQDFYDVVKKISENDSK